MLIGAMGNGELTHAFDGATGKGIHGLHHMREPQADWDSEAGAAADGSCWSDEAGELSISDGRRRMMGTRWRRRC